MKPRDSYFDNLKFILIVLVVVGHIIEPMIDKSVFLKAIFLCIYSFHMPLFVFVSGYFSKNIDRPGYGKKIISNLVIPYTVFESLYSIFDYFALKNETETFSITFFTPYWIMWFTFSLIIWKIVLPYFIKIKSSVIIAVVFAVLIGYVDHVGYPFGISRTIVFFPFFLGGYYLDKKHLEHLFVKRNRIVSSVILISAFLIILCFADTIDHRWLFGSFSYHALRHVQWYSGFYRLAVFSIAILTGAAFLSLIPKSKLTFISDMGTRTMYVYLLHGFVVKHLVKLGIYSNVNTGLERILLIGFAFLITVMLSTSFIRKKFRFIVEPKV